MTNNNDSEPKTKTSTADNAAKKENRSPFRLKSFLGYLLLALLPFIVSLALYYLVVELLDLWKQDLNLLLLTYGTIVLFFSLLFSIVMVDIKKWLGLEETNPKKNKAVTGAQRVFRIAVSGLIIPLIFSAAAYLVPVMGEDTVVSLLVTKMKSQPEYSFVEKIGETILASDSINTKVAGIEALAAIHTDEALDQLINILETEGCIHEYGSGLEYHSYSDALTKVFATYGVEAIEPLLVIFDKCDEQIKGTPEDSKDLYSTYFKNGFDEIAYQLTETGNLSSSDEEEIKARLNRIGNQVKLELLDLEKKISLSTGNQVSATALDLILGSFLQMENVENHSTIFNLSSEIAADPAFNYTTRSKAIELIAKFGSRADLDLLLPYLNEENETIKKAALQAIAVLSNKVEANP